ncbi:hypothetical protein [Pseudomonas aeruginosa]|uniref:hypothetical protein n=1 Tax=Pseudomonas aeruginosa TaxID=287 RepID=UPI00071B00D9|nr:hypothetical protein [Pseudomonas aeruginosa]
MQAIQRSGARAPPQPWQNRAVAAFAVRQATLQIIGGIVGAVSGFFGSGATAGSRISDYTGSDMANWVSKQRAQ